jgi:cytoskeleton protein RodZ
MSIGAQLRTAREAKGLSIDAIAERTRVQPRALAAIELNDPAALPPRPFGRGFVRAYAEEVGLDPDRTVRDYFAQFPPAPDISSLPPSVIRSEPAPPFALSSQWTGLAAAVGILALVVTAAVVMGRRGESGAEREAVGTAGRDAARPASNISRPAGSESGVTDPVAKSPNAQVAAATPLTLSFTVTRPCWVAATADGARAIYRIVDAGEQQTVTATQEIAIRFGDAGAVSWKINGRQGSALGETGAVRDLRITPENVAMVR